MSNRLRTTVASLWVLVATGSLAGWAWAEEPWRLIYPEQRRLEIRSPEHLQHAPIPDCPTPETVASTKKSTQVRELTLDEAVRLALENSPAVRVLGGETATLSGRTIYDPAISNTRIDTERGRFDPTLRVNNSFGRRDSLFPFRASADPNDIRIGESRTDDYLLDARVTKDTVTGGRVGVGVTTDPQHSNLPGMLLNPQRPTATDMSVTQPLLQGAGPTANLAPIVIARIDTERSFFQMKQSVQQMVLGVVQAYWGLVNARTDVKARRRQVEQGQWAYELAQARMDVGLSNATEVAQARSSLAGFRATLIAAESSLLQREAALRSMMQLPPEDGTRLIPVTPPIFDVVDPNWQELLRMAETYRPDLIETKLVLEADRQQLIIAQNRALPQLDAVGVYRFNGLEGRTPDQRIISESGRLGEWQIGVNFSVPLGLRTARAGVRRQELTIARGRTFLDEQLRDTSHVLATHYRNVAQYYKQFLAFRDTRDAAQENLDAQFEAYRIGRNTLYLDVLQAITQWGNAVGSMAQALTQYNAELAVLEQQTGTILETHGIRFAEERYASIGPGGRIGRDRCYPMASRPGDNQPRYQNSERPAEEAFGPDNPLANPPESERERQPRLPRDPRLEQPPDLPPLSPDQRPPQKGPPGEPSQPEQLMPPGRPVPPTPNEPTQQQSGPAASTRGQKTVPGQPGQPAQQGQSGPFMPEPFRPSVRPGQPGPPGPTGYQEVPPVEPDEPPMPPDMRPLRETSRDFPS